MSAESLAPGFEVSTVELRALMETRREDAVQKVGLLQQGIYPLCLSLLTLYPLAQRRLRRCRRALRQAADQRERRYCGRRGGAGQEAKSVRKKRDPEEATEEFLLPPLRRDQGECKPFSFNSVS